MAAVVVEELVKEFAGVRAVDGVSLAVKEGEFFTLLGPSGCGKTTLLRLVAGLERPEKGRIFIAGQEVTALPPARRRIAMVFQNYALYPHMTIRENIAYPLKLRRFPSAAITGKVENTAARLGIDHVLDRFPSAVSGGQQQRTAVARAMVQEPAVYLFDEPLSNLDARLRLESRRFLKQVLRESGGTAIYVTHDQSEALALSDLVGVMKDGRLVQAAPPEELYLRPASVFVAGFVGGLPMNLIPGVLAQDSGLWFEAGEFRLRLPASLILNPGQKIILGLRPENLVLGEEGELVGIIEDVEPQPGEQIITLNVAGISLLVRQMAEPRLIPGSRRALSFSPEKIHLFNEAGERLGE